MENDRDYVALCQIERSMQNEISAFSMSNSRLLDYIRSMSSSRMSLNGALKAMKCLAQIDLQQKNPRSADCVYAWMNALMVARKKPSLGMLFRSIKFSKTINEEFTWNENRMTTRLERERSRITWLVVISMAILMGILLATTVLILHADFFWMLSLALLSYALVLTYYFAWWDRKHYIYRLKVLTKSMSPESKQFIRSIDVKNLYWRPDFESIRTMVLLSIRYSRFEKLSKKETRQAKRNLRTVEKEQVREEKKTVRKTTVKTRTIEVETVPVMAASGQSVPEYGRVQETATRKAAPNRKRTGQAARAVFAINDLDSMPVSELDPDFAAMLLKSVRQTELVPQEEISPAPMAQKVEFDDQPSERMERIIRADRTFRNGAAAYRNAAFAGTKRSSK